jgi:hypothetical protein
VNSDMLSFAWKILPYTLPAIIAGIVIFIFFRRRMPNRRMQRQVLATGVGAPAKLLAIADTGVLWNRDPVVLLDLEVQPTDREAFRATVRTIVPKIAIPRVGEMVNVKFDPKLPNRVALDGSPSPDLR